MPKTSRGMRTRSALHAAARDEFEAEGYAGAGAVGITRRAGVSNGTFYFYYASKEAIFLAVLQEVMDEMAKGAHAASMSDGDAAEQIRSVNRRYLDLYAANSRFIRVVEEAANLNEPVRQVYRDIRRRQIGGVANQFALLQRRGLIDPDLDVFAMASVLGSMVRNAAYVIHYLDEDADRAAIEACLQLVQVRALKIKRGPSRPKKATVGQALRPQTG